MKYDVRYDGGRISALTNITLSNRDTLKYVYDDSGRVLAIQYVNGSGTVYTRIIFTFEGQQLRQLQRERKLSDGFIIDKQMTFAYYPDGNVRDITEHHPAIDGEQTETSMVDHYENYDTKINVDGFSLLHTEFFDHLVLLPGLQLQLGNPARQTHTGDGDNYVVDYTYSYDAANRPLTKSGRSAVSERIKCRDALPDTVSVLVLLTTNVFCHGRGCVFGLRYRFGTLASGGTGRSAAATSRLMS